MKSIVFCIVIFLFGANAEFSEEQILDDVLATVSYHVWYYPTQDGENWLMRDLEVETYTNNTFYSVMEEASQIDSDFFSFESEEFPFGHYIKSIGGIAEDPKNHIYWMLHKLDSDPDPSNPPGEEFISLVGVDGIQVKHEEIYLFWRKKVFIETR